MRAPRMKRKTLAIVVTLTLASAGGAYAYWTTTGTGSGTGSTTVGAATLSFTQNPAGGLDTSVPLAAMYPGDSSQNLTVRVRNTSTTASAYVTTVKAYITTDKPLCTGDNFLIAGSSLGTVTTPTSLTWAAVDLGSGAAANATSTVQFNNTAGNQDVCKSAAVTLNYVAN